MASEENPQYYQANGYPIWYWLQTHYSHPTHCGTTLNPAALTSLLQSTADPGQCLDGFVTFLKTHLKHGSFCVNPSCPGCMHSGQDVLLFVHLLSTHLRNFPDDHVKPQLIAKLISFSKECRVPLKRKP